VQSVLGASNARGMVGDAAQLQAPFLRVGSRVGVCGCQGKNRNSETEIGGERTFILVEVRGYKNIQTVSDSLLDVFHTLTFCGGFATDTSSGLAVGRTSQRRADRNFSGFSRTSNSSGPNGPTSWPRGSQSDGMRVILGRLLHKSPPCKSPRRGELRITVLPLFPGRARAGSNRGLPFNTLVAPRDLGRS